jgi:hypothetical protein
MKVLMRKDWEFGRAIVGPGLLGERGGPDQAGRALGSWFAINRHGQASGTLPGVVGEPKTLLTLSVAGMVPLLALPSGRPHRGIGQGSAIMDSIRAPPLRETRAEAGITASADAFPADCRQS